MIKNLLKSLILGAFAASFLVSCSSYDKLMTQLKYRGEYRHTDNYKRKVENNTVVSNNQKIEAGESYSPSINPSEGTQAAPDKAVTSAKLAEVKKQLKKNPEALASIIKKVENGEIKLSPEKKEQLKKVQEKLENQSTKGSGSYHWAAIVGAIMGILTIVTLLIPGNQGAFLFAVLGIIFSSIGLSKTGKNKAKGKGLAILGLVLSILYFVLLLLGILLLAALLSSL